MTSQRKENSQPGLTPARPDDSASGELPLFEESSTETPPALDEEEDDEADLTVESLTTDALSGDSVETGEVDTGVGGPPGACTPGDGVFDEPTRTADQHYREQVAREIAAARETGFDEEHTKVNTAPVTQTLQLPVVDEEGEPVSRGASMYRDMVEEDISISRALGYDKEGTAIVPLAELARREEERLRRGESLAEPEDQEEPRRSLPVGEIVDVLRAARTVEEVAGVLVEIVSNLLPKVLLMWERHGRLYGFASRGMDLTEVKLMTIEAPKGVFQQMAAADLDLDSFQGPPNTDGVAGRFFQILGYLPPEVLLVPIQVTAEDRWLLYADNDSDCLPDLELRLLEVIASRAGARADWLLDKQSIW